MKKLILLLIMLFSIITISEKSDVMADTNPVLEWACDTTYAPLNAYVATLEFGFSATGVIIDLPSNPYTFWDNGSYIFTALFYDSTDGAVSGFEMPDEFGDFFHAEQSYYFDFETLNIDQDAVYMTITIPVDPDHICTANGVTEYEENSSSTIVYHPTSSNLMKWHYELVAPDREFTVSEITPIPDGVRFLSFNFVLSSIDLHSPGGVDSSQIYFYDDEDGLLETFDIWQFVNTGDNELDFDLENMGLDREEVASFSIKEANYQFFPSSIYNHNLFFQVTYDNEILKTVNFWVDGVIAQSHTLPVGGAGDWDGVNPSLGAGFEFDRWIRVDTTPFINRTALLEEDFIEGVANIYAYFNVVQPPIVGDVDDLVADEGSPFAVFMAKSGYNDPIERTIIFGFLAIATAMFMLWRGVSTFAILIVVGFELGFFMYIGVIPLFVSIIIIVVLVFLGLKSGGGGNIE